MMRYRRIGLHTIFRAGAVAGLLAAVLSATAAGAVDVTVPVYRGPAVGQGDLQALQNRLSRQQFQQEQQQYRQDERNAVPVLRQQRHEVPRMKPSCQLQVNGSLGVCR